MIRVGKLLVLRVMVKSWLKEGRRAEEVIVCDLIRSTRRRRSDKGYRLGLRRRRQLRVSWKVQKSARRSCWLRLYAKVVVVVGC